MLLTFRRVLRGLDQRRGYSAAVIITLALTIGTTTAIFSAVYASLLKPLPITRPEALVICWERAPERNLSVVELSYRAFEEWRLHSRSFAAAAAVGSSTWPGVLERGEPARVATAGVSASFFETLGAAPALGRAFSVDDDLPNAAPVAILSHVIWTTRFGADPSVVGSRIEMDGVRTVVGVMPQGFDYPRGTDFWIPVVPVLTGPAGDRAANLRDIGVLFLVGRLRSGVTPEMAREELNQLSAQQQKQGIPHFGSQVVVTPFLDYVLGPVRQALWALLAAAIVLLIIGCTNVSGLMLTRVSRRRREQAVRVALGATRIQVGREWFVETLILSTAGGVMGVAASYWVARAIVVLAPPDIPRLGDVAINVPVALFSCAIVAAAAVLCGAAPVRQAGAFNLVETLNDAARGTPGRQVWRARSLLLVVQISLTILLLVAGGLVVRSFINLQRIDLGFVPTNVVMLNVTPRSAPSAVNKWMAEFLDRVEALPDVDAAGAVYLRPLALGPIGQEAGVILEGQPVVLDTTHRNPALNYEIATAGYFHAMRIPLLEGRLFTDRDTADAPPAALVSASTARTLWPGRSAIGRRFMLTHDQAPPERAWRTVVGVVSDVRYRGIDDVRLDVYDAPLQARSEARDVVVRGRGDARRLISAVQAEARRLDPGVLIDGVTTLDNVVARATAPWRFTTWTLSLFAIMAFGLSALGLFSLVSLDVADRRHEFALRIALGATREKVVRLVLVSLAKRIVPGLLLGVVASAAGTQTLRALLFGVEAVDAATYAVVVLLIMCVTAVAASVPARRAALIDPLMLFRHG
ncbi:MAG: ABC transporter permease [Vicinamibacterales bacterium]